MPTPVRELDILSFAQEKWGVIPRISHRIPYGYAEDPEDPTILQPVVFELEALEKAKDYLKRGHSLRKVSEWITEKTGRKITHEGLKQRVLHDRSDRRKSTTTRRWAESLAEAVKKAKDFDERYGYDTEWYDDLVAHLLSATAKGRTEKLT